MRKINLNFAAWTSYIDYGIVSQSVSHVKSCLRTKYRVRLVQLLQNADRSSILIILTQAESFMKPPQVVGNGRCEVTSIDENWSVCVCVCKKEREKEIDRKKENVCLCISVLGILVLLAFWRENKVNMAISWLNGCRDNGSAKHLKKWMCNVQNRRHTSHYWVSHMCPCQQQQPALWCQYEFERIHIYPS